MGGENPLFIERATKLAQEIPSSNGTSYYEGKFLKIGIIADELLFHLYEGTAQYIYLTPSNYLEKVEDIQLLIVCSVWVGLHGEWIGVSSPGNTPLRHMIDMTISLCKARDIPTIFYSKEDPINYRMFLDIAKRCEFVFTTAVEMVDSYKRDCRHNRVYVLPFCVNPLLHNPIGSLMHGKEKEVLFSGSWYEVFEERKRDMQLIFDGVLEAGYELGIVDRNYALRKTRPTFPAKYQSGVIPSLSIDELQKVHKLFPWAININTVKDSETMFAGRVYEMQALGNVILSNYNKGIEKQFPNVFLVSRLEEVIRALKNTTAMKMEGLKAAGIRNVMTDNTCYERLDYILDCIGYSYSKAQPRVLVLTELLESGIAGAYKSQKFAGKSLKALSDLKESDLLEYEYIAYFQRGINYSMNYLQDLINGFKYTKSDFITVNLNAPHQFVAEYDNPYVTMFRAAAYDFKDLKIIPENQLQKTGYSVGELY